MFHKNNYLKLNKMLTVFHHNSVVLNVQIINYIINDNTIRSSEGAKCIGNNW